MPKRIIVEYMPKLSERAINMIKAEVSYSMISNDETSCQYVIDQCVDVLERFNDEEIYGNDLWKINELILEGVNYLDTLEPGDVIIYASNTGFKTARIEKKPVLDTRYPGYYKSIRCKIFTETKTIYTTKWDSVAGIRVPKSYESKIQKFSLSEFNTVKYLQIYREMKVLKVKSN